MSQNEPKMVTVKVEQYMLYPGTTALLYNSDTYELGQEVEMDERYHKSLMQRLEKAGMKERVAAAEQTREVSPTTYTENLLPQYMGVNPHQVLPEGQKVTYTQEPGKDIIQMPEAEDNLQQGADEGNEAAVNAVQGQKVEEALANAEKKVVQEQKPGKAK